MKFLIFKRISEEIGEKINSYESNFKDDTSRNRSEVEAEPKAIHIELPEGLDEDCVVPQWMELQPEQIITLREPFPGSDAEIDGEGNIIVEAIEAQEGLYTTIPAVWGWGLIEDVDKKLAKRQTKANSNLEKIRNLRERLLIESDYAINKLEDDGIDASLLRQWRKALRECTDDLKKINGDAKLSCENLVPSEFQFPVKPE